MLAFFDIQILYWTLLAIVGGLGMFALVDPARFQRFASGSSKWIDTEKVLSAMDKRVEIDRHVLRHCRAFGGTVVVSAAVLAYLYFTYIVLG